VLAFVVDTSGSFLPMLFGGDQKGYRFFLKTSELFFRNRMGPRDRILISQLSADSRTLLWEGLPRSLRRDFATSDTLRQFIEQRSNPAGSRVYASVADTLDYLYGLPGVSDGRTQICVIVLTDFLDNSPTQQQDRQRMVESLKRFGQTNASVGFYWVDQYCLQDCRQCLADSGLRNYAVETDVVRDPTLPFANQ
jgi:hypothetical protein